MNCCERISTTFFGVWVGVQYLIESKWTTEQQRLPLLLCGRPGVDLERMRTQSGLLCEGGADESVALDCRLELDLARWKARRTGEVEI